MKRFFMLILTLALTTAALAEAGLPAYTYTGDDLIEAAAVAYMLERAEAMYYLEEGSVTIPSPLIFRVEQPDDETARVYGNFWVYTYNLEGKTLFCISGGEEPAVLTLKKAGEGWTVADVLGAEDGDGFAESLRALAGGDEALLAQFLNTDDTDVRERFIREYVSANGLDVEAYQDYGWDPVLLNREVSAEPYSLLQGKRFVFASGVGAWDTTITFGAEGSFTGEFHDSEMGETGEGYPDGTVYGCTFHGRLADAEQADSLTWTLTVAELEMDEGQAPEAIEDGIRFVTTDPYGLKAGDAITLYLPGTPVSGLPEDFLFWTHIQEIDPDAETLPWMTLRDDAAQSGFVCETDME